MDLFGIQGQDDRIKDKTEETRRQEYKFVGSYRYNPKLNMYRIHTGSFEVEEVEIKKEVMVGLEGEVIKKNRAEYDPNWIYFQALNWKNAGRKAGKIRKQIEELKNQEDKDE